jgi:urocanate hydratase
LKSERRYLVDMGRNVLFLLGAGAIGWAALCLFAGSVMPDWMGLSGAEHGELYIESLALNVGLWIALGVFGILGGMFQRLRLAGSLAFLVVAGGIAGGRILALVQGARPGVYTGIAMALEVAIVVAASAAYVSERTRLAREAKELKKAEKAALEAALAAEHAQQQEAAAPPSPIQQP